MTSQSINPSWWQKAVQVNSTSRVNGSSTNFSQNVKIPSSNNQCFNKASLLKADIPKGWYMVEAGESVSFNYTDGAGTRAGSLFTSPAEFGDQERNYTATELASHLASRLDQASLAGSGNTHTVVFDTSRGKFRIDSDITSFTIAFTDTLPATQRAKKYLGMNDTQTSTGLTLSSPNRANLQRYDVIQLHTSLVDNAGDDILAELYFNGTSNSDVLEWTTPDAWLYAKGMSNNRTNQVNFSLTDENGKPVNLNGLEWRASIVLYDDTQKRP